MADTVDTDPGLEPTDLKRGLKQRHLTMIAMGGVIGAGLFVGSGVVIGNAGPSAFSGNSAHSRGPTARRWCIFAVTTCSAATGANRARRRVMPLIVLIPPRQRGV